MRTEFSKKTMREAYERSEGLCEGILASGERCCFPVDHKKHFDHVIPDALGGDNSLTNCAVLCLPCHGKKTQKIDIPMIAKSKRNYDKHRGIRKPSRFPGSRDSRFKKKIDGSVVLRCLPLLALLLLTGCYEPASTYDSHKGRYRPTDEVRRDEINREIDKREMERERAPVSR